MPSDSGIPTLTEALAVVDPSEEGSLYAVLLHREEHIAEALHEAGLRFGLFPQIVAEVLAEVGLGAPKSEEERAYIRTNFVNLLAQIERAQSGEGPMPTP